jgi:hypothetical protein
LETPVLRWIGSRSYSIYIWHWPILMLTRPGFDINLPALPVRIGQIALTFFLAELSYRRVESPVRQHGFGASIRSLQATFRGWTVFQKLGAGAGILSVSLLLVWQGSIHQVTASPPLGEISSTPSPLPGSLLAATATPPFVSTQTSSGAPETLVGTLTATPGDAGPRATLIGDSIMQGAAPMIEDVLGSDVYLDAARKRKMEDVPAVVETLDESGHLARVVVIHLGSNRPFEDSVFDEVMRTLLAHRVERVIFINVHRPIGWEYYVNQKFVKDVARWPQAELIDWHALSQHEQGWFISDQTHLSYYGSRAYVNAIKQKLETNP